MATFGERPHVSCASRSALCAGIETVSGAPPSSPPQIPLHDDNVTTVTLQYGPPDQRVTAPVSILYVHYTKVTLRFVGRRLRHEDDTAHSQPCSRRFCWGHSPRAAPYKTHARLSRHPNVLGRMGRAWGHITEPSCGLAYAVERATVLHFPRHALHRAAAHTYIPCNCQHTLAGPQ